MGEAVDEAVAASRRLYPELWEKADEIARIIEPGIWDDWYDSTAPGAQPRPPSTRIRYYRARAVNKAWKVLEALGIAPETTDWEAIFTEMFAASHPTREAETEGE